MGCLFAFGLINVALIAGGRTFKGSSPSGESIEPLMTATIDPNSSYGLPVSWRSPAQAREYPICKMRWGAPDAELSVLDTAALSWIAYEPNCSNVNRLLELSFASRAERIKCTNYTDIPRWIAVRFHAHGGGGSSDGRNTIAIAVKGTSTSQDAYLDTDLFTSIKVLRAFSFIAPVLQVIPMGMVQYLLAGIKKISTGGISEQSMWTAIVKDVRTLQAENSNSDFVLTGHSLGGAIAEIAAGQLGVSALVWSAPGTVYNQRFFNVSEEQMQRDVVAVVPDNDEVPLVDGSNSFVQQIQCYKKWQQLATPLDCHSLCKSACEVWRVCGDKNHMPHPRNFSGLCSRYLDKSELGKLYKVWDRPMVGR